MNKEFIRALDEIEREKDIKKEDILGAVERALKKSYEDNYDESNVEVEINPKNGDVKVYAIKEVVETFDEVENKDTQIALEEALTHSKRAKVGNEIKIKVTPKNFARVAAQKARNIVIQQIRDSERKSIYDSYIDKEKEIINGTVQRIDFNNIFIDLGKSEGILPEREQVIGEDIQIGDRIKVFVKEVKETNKGPQIILSRKDSEFIKKLFEIEVPEIGDGVVDIKSVSREAGYRTKIAVRANDETIDPVGACVGMKGRRVNAIVDEINGEKIDIIVWDEDMKVFISNSISPAEVIDVYIDQENQEAVAFVPEEQLSLAIGKEGQNVRLAAKLTNWKIDIKSDKVMDEVLKELEEEKNNLKASDEGLEEVEIVEDNELIEDEK